MKKAQQAITVIKASGLPNAFSSGKLRESLRRSGASAELVNTIVEQIIAELYDGITTNAIYNKAFKLLKQHKKGPAAKYKLKSAIMELGPTGFPFEQFIARIFKSMGYSVQTGKIIPGKCVKHEVDVIAGNKEEQLFIECKFHPQKGIFCDVKIPLYISARFRDIEERWLLAADRESRNFQGWLVTNTHFSKDAVSYGVCAGLKLIGWSFPDGSSLRELIDRYGLHPITSLTTLTRFEKRQLMEQNIILCSELTLHSLEHIISPERMQKVNMECAHLCGTPPF